VCFVVLRWLTTMAYSGIIQAMNNNCSIGITPPIESTFPPEVLTGVFEDVIAGIRSFATNVPPLITIEDFLRYADKKPLPTDCPDDLLIITGKYSDYNNGEYSVLAMLADAPWLFKSTVFVEDGMYSPVSLEGSQTLSDYVVSFRVSLADAFKASPMTTISIFRKPPVSGSVDINNQTCVAEEIQLPIDDLSEDLKFIRNWVMNR